jgi:hypothetical protein
MIEPLARRLGRLRSRRYPGAPGEFPGRRKPANVSWGPTSTVTTAASVEIFRWLGFRKQQPCHERRTHGCGRHREKSC